MTVCQYFLEGRCRFGQNCRFEHSFPNDDRNNRNSANTQQLKDIIRQIVAEVIIAEKGKQWPLTCFAPVKEGMNIPGWEDTSPEEIRWKMYEARNNGTINKCIKEINQLYSEAEKRRNEIKHQSIKKINLILNMLQGKKQNNVSNPFMGSANSNNSQSPFGDGGSMSNHSIFGGTVQTYGNIFGNVTNYNSEAAKSDIFHGMNAVNTYSQNFFSNPQSVNTNLFSNSPVKPLEASVYQNSIFSNEKSTPQVAIFKQEKSGASIFGSQDAIFKTHENPVQEPNCLENEEKGFNNQPMVTKAYEEINVFGKLAQSYSPSNTTSQLNKTDYTVYSKVENLNEEELKAFANATFSFGNIPLKPPPFDYCK